MLSARFRLLAGLAGSAVLLGGCAAVPERAAPARPLPLPRPAPTPAPAPVEPSRPASDWRDWPVAPGSWAYRQDERGSIALFGRAGEDADLTLRCDRGRRRIYFSRRLATPAADVPPVEVRTTGISRTLAVLPAGAAPPYAAVELAVSDPLLDAIGFSRGHFAVIGAGMPALVVPAWAEILRVVEDCRG